VRDGIPVEVITDGMAGALFGAGVIDYVVVGADRIAQNGDTANKIGTYGVAILAAHHGIPFYVAAPRSTFDFTIGSGAQIPIEERSPDEVRLAPADDVYNPAFDVTPGHLIAAFITEYGLLRPPYLESVPDLEDRPRLAALAR
jgi:methylthioribose-1-phosphate isomerase